MLKIPSIDDAIIHFSPKQISIISKTNETRVTDDGWQILKLCDRTRSVNQIKQELSQSFDIKENELDKFLLSAEIRGIIKYYNSYGDATIKTVGSRTRYFPQVISLELTNKCNLRCTYCYGSYKSSGDKFLDFNKIENLFKIFHNNGVITVELTGGEPLLHPNFDQILKLAVKYFYRVNILSNGTQFKDSILKYIDKNKSKIALQISIDGCTEHTNYKVRKTKNTWLKTLRTIEYLRDHDIQYRIPYMLTNENREELLETCEFFQKNNLRNLAITEVSLVGRACESSDCSLRDSAYKDGLIETLHAIESKYSGILFKINKDNTFKIIGDNCGAGWLSAVISSNGDVYSCLILNKSSKLGNIYKDEILGIFNNSMTYLYAKFSKFKDEKACKDCNNSNFCARCIMRIFIANKERLKQNMDMCSVAIANKMEEMVDFKSDFIYKL